MGIDFAKQLKEKKKVLSKDPIEIYEDLDRSASVGPLRPVQINILTEWYKNRKDNSELIIKLPTGAGKTLIGLLILKSKLNAGLGPCLYVCPNNYLANQARLEAERFGIDICIFKDRTIPREFIEGKAILITTAHKFFNGMTVFGVDARYTEIGTIILDDSHACIDVVNNAFSITLEKNIDAYQEMLSLFTPDLKRQGEGSFLDLCNNDYDTLMQIPYWSWMDKSSEVLEILVKYKAIDEIKFSWNLLKDIIPKCKAFVTGQSLEITPYYIPIEKFPAFQKAKNKILMSATTQNDAFLIQGLGFQKETVSKPLVDESLKWSGEKMLIIPELVNSDPIFSENLRSYFAKLEYPFGALAIVPSNNKSKVYTVNGAELIGQEELLDRVNFLKSNNFKDKVRLTVISNKYDGIDLADSACRLLILDSLPYFENLSDSYEERVRPSGDLIQKKLAQKIEQGLGRSVRGEKDYSVIVLMGNDLVDFITNTKTKEYFSAETQQQIEIGKKIMSLSKDESFSSDSELKKHIISVINQSLKRDVGWKEYYRESMDQIESIQLNTEDYFDLMELEYDAEREFYRDNYQEAISTIQTLMDKVSDQSEKGWYLQSKARFEYNLNKTNSIATQKVAHKYNDGLLLPNEIINYEKLEYIDGNRNQEIINQIKMYRTHEKLLREVQTKLDYLSFGQKADKFENSLDFIGRLLGYVTDRPDKKIRKGPDNLWCVRSNEFFLFECKSEIKENRDCLNKTEVGQFNNHCGWFEEQYGKQVSVRRFILSPTLKISYESNFTHDVQIIRKGKLEQLKQNILSFIKELSKYNVLELHIDTIDQLLVTHKLKTDNFSELYSEEYRKIK